MIRKKDRALVLKACAVMLLVSGCNRENGTDSPGYGELVPIRVSTTVATRAGVVEDDTGLQDQTFGVFAYDTKDGGTNIVDVFSNQEVSYSKTDSEWTYSPEKYWNTQATYYFAAYSPKLGTTSGSGAYVENSFSSKKATLTVHDIPYWQEVDGTELDFMYSTSKGTGSSYVDDYAQTVNFTFKHLLSRLRIYAYYSGDAADIKATGLSIGSSTAGEQVPSASGKADWKVEYTTPTPASINAALSGSKALLENGNITVAATETLLADWLVAPFSADKDAKAKPIALVYYDNGTMTEVKPKAVSSGITSMAAGKVYTITLKITVQQDGDQVIVVGAEVQDWSDVETDGQLYNW